MSYSENYPNPEKIGFEFVSILQSILGENLTSELMEKTKERLYEFFDRHKLDVLFDFLQEGPGYVHLHGNNMQSQIMIDGLFAIGNKSIAMQNGNIKKNLHDN